SDTADAFVTNAGVIFTLRIGKAVTAGEAERSVVFPKEIFLFKTEPGAGVVKNRRARVAWVRSLHVGHVNFAHDQCAVLARGIRVDRDGLQHAVRAFTFGLASRAAVEAPPGEFFQLRKLRKFFDLSFATEVRNGFVTIEPDVF